MRSPRLAAAAAAVLTLEGVALAVVALVEILSLSAGDVASLPTAIALIALTLVGSAALCAFAVGTRRGRTWARSGGVVLQLLALALALASLTLQPVLWTFVLGVGAPALVGLILLIASARAESAEPVDDPTSE